MMQTYLLKFISYSYSYGGIFILYDQILKEKQLLEQKIPLLEENLKNLPDGNLVCCHHQNLCKWYYNDGQKRHYIPKTNRQFAEQLALKKLYTYQLQEARTECQALTAYLKHAPKPSSYPSHELLKLPGYQDLLASSLKPLSQELKDWANVPYEKNPLNPEALIVPAISGHMVRSKSEAMIAHCLFTHQIPFRYECALQLGGKTVFPDFTIRHPQTGEFFYWEHFGLMDTPSYCRNMAHKMQLYALHEITPTLELIVTFEKSAVPFSSQKAMEVIKTYFL